MSQNNSNDKAAMLAMIEKINEVSGFDPAPFAVDYTDLNTGETRKRLPVMIQMAWFRMKYPEGKISVQVTPAKDCFVATARVYPKYSDSVDAYLAEATASRSFIPEKPSVSPREWAQTAAVGIALRNAGFGLQFSMAGEDFEETAPDELGITGNATEQVPVQVSVPQQAPQTQPEEEMYTATPITPAELTPEEKLQQAMAKPCPITKFSGKTLGEVLPMDPGAITWVATKFKGDEEISAAARFICEYASQQATA